MKESQMTQNETPYYQNTQSDAQTFFNNFKKKGLLNRFIGNSSDTDSQQQHFNSIVKKGGIDISDVHPAHFIKALVDMQTPMGMGWISHLQNTQMISYTVEEANSLIENSQENYGGSKEVYLDYENGKRIKSSVIIFPELKKTVFVQGEYGYETDTGLARSIVETLKEGKPLPLPGAADLMIALLNDNVLDLNPIQKLKIGVDLVEGSGLPQPSMQQVDDAMKKYTNKRSTFEQKQAARFNSPAPQNRRGSSERC